MADDTESQGTVQTSTEQASQTNTSQPPVQSQPSIDLTGVMTALNALPEQISRAVKEAVTPPKQAPVQKQQSTQDSTEKQTQSKQETSQPAHTPPGKKKSFSDWWFNG
jgi:hypothetical protein